MTSTQASGTMDAAALIRDLDLYLGRLVLLLDDKNTGATSSTNNPGTGAGRGQGVAFAPTPTVWLDNGPPPDPNPTHIWPQYSATPATTTTTTTNPTPAFAPFTQPQPNQASREAPQQGGNTQNDAAERFLMEILKLIKVFLAQQHKDETNTTAAATTTRAVTAPPPAPPASSPPAATAPFPTAAPSKETESRLQVLRQAVAAAEADAAAKEIDRRPESRAIVQQIERQWDAALAENNALKLQLGQANQHHQELFNAKTAAEQLLMEKEILLAKIRQAILDLKQELNRHKVKLQQASRNLPPPIPPPNREKQALVDKLRQGIADLEAQLQRIQAEKRALEEDLLHIQGEKQGLQSDLERTLNALRTHQGIKQTLEQSFQNAETEVQALKQLLKQLEVDDATRPPATAPPISAFQPPAPSPYSGTHRDVTVETVHSEPGSTPGAYHYQYQQNQASWQEPPKQYNWEAQKQYKWQAPKQHTWEPIQKQPPTDMAVYHVEVPQPTKEFLSNGNNPEWTQQRMAEQEQQRMSAEKPKWNYDPPAEYLSVDGEQESQQNTPRQYNWREETHSQPYSPQQYYHPQHQQPWRPADPAAYNGTGSVGYSSNGVPSHMLESVEGASYYGSRSQQSYPPEQPQEQWPPHEAVWSNDYGSRRSPQEPPPSTISTTKEFPSGGHRMAFLQEQMANAVDDARNNPSAAAPLSYRSQRPLQPAVKLPLQPAPVGVVSPERVVPSKQEAWPNHRPTSYGNKPPSPAWR